MMSYRVTIFFKKITKKEIMLVKNNFFAYSFISSFLFLFLYALNQSF